MDEVRAAYGLLSLRYVDAAIESRRKVAEQYRASLRDVPGLRIMEDIPGVTHNYSYFPVFVNEEEYGESRDSLYFRLKEHDILGRPYFYPLISTFSTYRGMPSATSANLPVATRLADQVICLPLHHELSCDETASIINLLLRK
jgi:dTDP-4-amino-4,6-dideoxygalactose transaminase